MDLIRVHAKARRDACACGIQQESGPSAGMVEPGRIGPAVLDRREPGLSSPWVEGLSAYCIEISGRRTQLGQSGLAGRARPRRPTDALRPRHGTDGSRSTGRAASHTGSP